MAKPLLRRFFVAVLAAIFAAGIWPPALAQLPAALEAPALGSDTPAVLDGLFTQPSAIQSKLVRSTAERTAERDGPDCGLTRVPKPRCRTWATCPALDPAGDGTAISRLVFLPHTTGPPRL